MSGLTISDYSDYRDFLKAWFWDAKKSQSKVSFRYMSKHLGLSSPNHFHLVISKKRHLSESLVEKVSKFLKLSSREKQYFKLLFSWDFAVDDEERKRISSRLQQLKGQLAQEYASDEKLPVVGDKLAWYIKMGSVVFEGKSKSDLLSLIPRTCRFPVSELEVFQAFELLEKAKMLSFASGVAQFEGGAIVTQWNLDRSEIKNHHLVNLKLASETVLWPMDQRFLSSVTIPCNSKLYETFVEDIRSLCRGVFEKTNALVQTSADVSEVVTMQIALFPYFKFEKTTDA